MPDRTVQGRTAPIPIVTTFGAEGPTNLVEIRPATNDQKNSRATREKKASKSLMQTLWGGQQKSKPKPKAKRESKSSSKSPSKPIEDSPDWRQVIIEPSYPSALRTTNERRPHSLDSGIGIRPLSAQGERLVEIKPKVRFVLPGEEPLQRARSTSPRPNERRPSLDAAPTSRRDADAEIRRLNTAIQQLQSELQQQRFLAASGHHLRLLDDRIARLRDRLDEEQSRQAHHMRYLEGMRQRGTTGRNPPPVIHPPDRVGPNDTGRRGGPATSSPRPSTRPNPDLQKVEQREKEERRERQRRIRNEVDQEQSADERLDRQQKIRDEVEQEELADERRRAQLGGNTRRRDSHARRDRNEQIIFDDQKKNAFNKRI